MDPPRHTPEDFPLLTDWTEPIIGIDDPASGGSPDEGLSAVNELFGYVTELGEEKRRSPDGTVVSELVNSTIHLDGEPDERPLTPPEIDMFFFPSSSRERDHSQRTQWRCPGVVRPPRRASTAGRGSVAPRGGHR